MASKPSLPPRPLAPDSRSDVDSTSSVEEQGLSDHDHDQDFRFLSPSWSQSSSSHVEAFYDPRSSSTQSLRPVETAGERRRTLLIIYIHGFLGTEMSFKSFPAHVHRILSQSLKQTHVVYTKIYPRYKSRKNISFARDDFSHWMAPHESERTDIVLVGHSLGGILAAEVVLIPSRRPGSSDLFHHRILGLISFDSPFLGIHPSVVGTGIASLFRSSPSAPESPADTDFLGLEPSGADDPTYNPTYANDVRRFKRKSKLQKAWHFWSKHAGDFARAAGSYVSSHIEFGGCLADYPGLKKRYNAIRQLEDVDEGQTPRAHNGRLMKRVRFVNYYSASTGRIKEKTPPPESESGLLKPPTPDSPTASAAPNSAGMEPGATLSAPPSASPQLSLEEHRDGEVITKHLAELNIDPEPPAPAGSPMMGADTSHSPHDEGVNEDVRPEPPSDLDPSRCDDGELRKEARPEHAEDAQACEERDSLPTQLGERPAEKDMKPSSTRQAPRSHQSDKDDARCVEGASPARTRPKDRKFCTLPPKNPQTGKPDPTWIRVYMEGIDEVVAHTSMFQMGGRYVEMVLDTTDRIESWVAENAASREQLGS